MKWRLQASLALIVLSAALPARAWDDGPSTLTACNHGTTTAQVVIAAGVGFPVAYEINGYVMAPGDCKIVYHLIYTPAYIGIAILDGRGQWVAGTADTVPDFGTTATSALGALLFGEKPVLTRGSAILCYRGDTTQYQIRRGEAFPTDCSGFHPAGDKGSGPFMPLMTIFQFVDPVPSRCYGGVDPGCSGGDYYLNIAPSVNSRDVRATTGTKDGASVPASVRTPRADVSANGVPTEFDNKAKYGIYLYSHLGQLSYSEANTIYSGMVTTLGKDAVESAAEKVRTAEKTPNGDLVTHVKEPYKLGPNGSRVEDYDVPFPPGVIGVYKNPLVAMEVLATEDSDAHYLLYLFKSRFQENRRFLPKDADKWTFAKNAYDGLTRAFGRDQVQAAAHAVHAATKRLLSGSIMNQQTLGATRNDPFEAFEDILARKDPRGYVKAAIAFNENLFAPASVDADAAYQKLVAQGGEDKVLEAARTLAAGKPHFLYSGELGALKQLIDRR